MQVKNFVILTVAAGGALVFGQAGAAIAGGGYAAPGPINAAPGQVMTIFVTGIGSGITQRVAASSYPLPTTLAGISASFVQYWAFPDTPLPAPLLAVYPIDVCLGVRPCSSLLGITLQIPFELVPNLPQPPESHMNFAEITVSDATNTSATIGIAPVSSQIHILRYGDTVAPDVGFFGSPLVTHANGSLVLPGSPAEVGEILIAYAVGLGLTDPRVKTGAAAPPPTAGSSIQLPLIFDYRPNASPSTMLLSSWASSQQGSMIQSTSIFAGLVPGYAGLYQVNFQVPAPPGPVPACDNVTVTSNLTVNLIGAAFRAPSFDGAAICVAVNASQ